MLRSSIAGERATWPKLSRIRDRCAIELALDNAVHRLRTKVVFSESRGDLRSLGVDTLPPLTAASSNMSSSNMLVGSVQRRLRRRSGGSLQRMSQWPNPFEVVAKATDDDRKLADADLARKVERIGLMVGGYIAEK